MKRFLRRYSLALRVIALFMAALTVTLTVTPAAAPSADAADTPSYGAKRVSKWVRATPSDLPKDGKIILVWEGDGTYYATLGRTRDREGRNFYGVDITKNPTIRFASDGNVPEFFYTDVDLDPWYIYVDGVNMEDSGMSLDIFQRAHFSLGDRKSFVFDNYETLVWSSSYKIWHLVTSGYENTHYYCDSGRIALVYEETGFDDYIEYSGNKLSIDEFGAFDYDCTAFDFIYYVEKGYEEYTTISSDYKVKAGTTLQIKNQTMLENNVTLTVEPGAVLSVSGKFINNGNINNYGTVILNEGATVCSYGERSYTGGSITNYGGSSTYYDSTKKALKGEGNMIIMKNANLILPSQTSTGFTSSATLKFFPGATLVNYGMVFVPGSMLFSGALVQNKPSGVICTHVTINGSEYNSMAFKWSDRNNFKLEERTGVNTDFNNNRTVVENDGYWHNYSQSEWTWRLEYYGTGTKD